MLISGLAESADREHDDSGRWGLSIATHASKPLEAIVELYFKRYPGAPRRKMRLSTVGAVKGAGFDVIRSGRPPHGLILAAAKPTEDDWTNADRRFRAPTASPASL
jgi:hypothetical protein